MKKLHLAAFEYGRAVSQSGQELDTEKFASELPDDIAKSYRQRVISEYERGFSFGQIEKREYNRRSIIPNNDLEIKP